MLTGVWSIAVDYFESILFSTVFFRSNHQRCSVRKSVLINFKNSQKNTCARVPFLIKLQALGAGTFLWILRNFQELLFLKNISGGCFWENLFWWNCKPNLVFDCKWIRLPVVTKIKLAEGAISKFKVTSYSKILIKSNSKTTLVAQRSAPKTPSQQEDLKTVIPRS